MRDYSISEEKANEVRAALDQRKGQKKPVGYEEGMLLSLTDGTIKLSKHALSLSKKSLGELNTMVKQNLENGLHGLCFSPYVQGQQDTDVLTETQIRRRMELIASSTQWVRSFACTRGHEHIPNIAKENNLKTMVGAWISDDKVRNEEEIQSLIELGKSGLVDIAVVGNEVLLRNELSESELKDYISKVKSALPNIPVCYVDTYYELYKHPEISESSDLILANFYPFWEGSPIEHSESYLQKMLELTKTFAHGKKIIIAETGWPTKGQNVSQASPSLNNAAKYFLQAQHWAKENNIDLFYFSSFDESWKLKIEGEVGARWGLWDEDEKLKYE